MPSKPSIPCIKSHNGRLERVARARARTHTHTHWSHTHDRWQDSAGTMATRTLYHNTSQLAQASPVHHYRTGPQHHNSPKINLSGLTGQNGEDALGAMSPYRAGQENSVGTSGKVEQALAFPLSPRDRYTMVRSHELLPAVLKCCKCLGLTNLFGTQAWSVLVAFCLCCSAHPHTQVLTSLRF